MKDSGRFLNQIPYISSVVTTKKTRYEVFLYDKTLNP